MSYAVTALVRAARLPRTIKRHRRPAAKSVLLSLADRCNNDGTNAFPAVATIAAESELGMRTVDRLLADLRAVGLIDEQAPPRQHRPRTWRLNLDALWALEDPERPVSDRNHLEALGRLDRLCAPSDPQHVATLSMRALTPELCSDPQHVATLTLCGNPPDPPNPTSGPSISLPDPPTRASDPQHVATDPVLNSHWNGQLNGGVAAENLSLMKANDPDPSYYRALDVATGLVERASSRQELVEQVRSAYADCDADVLERAATVAWMRRISERRRA